MILSLLFEEPIIFLVWVVAIIIAITIHEFSHALAGTWQGDMTAKNQGRLTLNPMSHLSGVGFLMLLLVGFGWGKPVPFNPYNLKNKRWGPALISIAGPASNLILALFAGVILKTFVYFDALEQGNLLLEFLYLLVIINVILMIFNLIPIPPLDGSKLLFSILHSPKYNELKMWLTTKGPLVLMALIFMDFILNINIFSGLFRLIINGISRLLF